MGTTQVPVKHSFDLQMEFQNDPQSVSEKLIGSANTEETKEKLRQILSQSSVQPAMGPEATHDQQLLALAEKLVRAQGAGWLIIGKIWSVMKGFFVWLLTACGCFLTIGGMVYFVIYCAHFGFGTTMVPGFIVFFVLNVFVHLVTPSCADYNSPISDWRFALLLGSCASLVILGAFTGLTVLTPSPDVWQPHRQDVGVIVGPDGKTIRRVIYPVAWGGSVNKVNDQGSQTFVAAPNFLTERAEWFGWREINANRGAVILNGQQAQLTVDMILTPDARPGRVLSQALKADQDYLDDLWSKCDTLQAQSVRNGSFDSKLFIKLVDEQLSNDVFRAKVGPAGLTLSMTNNVTP